MPSHDATTVSCEKPRPHRQVVVHVEAAHDGLAPAGIVVPTADPALQADPCLITRTSERNVVLARLCAADTAVVILDASRSSRLGAARGEEERNRDAD